ncbi:MAG: Appr-1-p processing protein [Candidatus Thorarchaeota archaeon]
MTKYEMKIGDVLEVLEGSPPVIVPHICNNIGAWGKGFTAAIDAVYPEVGDTVRERAGSCVLGDVIYVQVGERSQDVACMIAQNGVRSKDNPTPIKYVALVKCMEDVFWWARDAGVAKICCPRFGSGLAGGKWEFIELLIKEIWVGRGLDVTVYTPGELL